MPWIAVGISIFATLFSAISLLGSPGWVFDHDLTLGLSLLTIPLITPIVIAIFLPFYHRLRVFTAYEYLEKRFNPQVRTVASLLFLFQRGCYLAVVIYAPSLVLSAVTGLQLGWTIMLIGGLATFYTLMGGMKAVIWTDVVQTVVLVAGLLVVVWVLVSRVQGGIEEIIRVGLAQGPFQVDLSWGDWTIVSLWAVLVNGVVINMSQYGADQIVLQRSVWSKRDDPQCNRRASNRAALVVRWRGSVGFLLEEPCESGAGCLGRRGASTLCDSRIAAGNIGVVHRRYLCSRHVLYGLRD